MGADEKDGFVVETLGDLIALGGGIAVSCAPYPVGCGRTLDVDVYDLAWLFGSRTRHVPPRMPLKCSVCGSRHLEWRVSSNTSFGDRRNEGPRNFRSSRSDEERRALMLLYPRHD